MASAYDDASTWPQHMMMPPHASTCTIVLWWCGPTNKPLVLLDCCNASVYTLVHDVVVYRCHGLVISKDDAIKQDNDVG